MNPIKKVFVAFVLFASSFGYTHDATFADDWVKMLYARVKGESVTPPVAARVFAYTGIALNEALAALGEADSLKQGVREGLEPPRANADTFDTLTVVSAALHTVTGELMRENSRLWQPFSAGALETKRALSALHAEQVAARQQGAPDDVMLASLELGAQVGDAVLAWAARDGFTTARKLMYASEADLFRAREADPALWVPRGSGRKPIEPFWGRLEPLALASARTCHVPLGMNFSTEPESEFFEQVLEVYNTSQTLSDDELETALFWDDEPVETGTIGGHFLMIGRVMVARFDLSLEEAAHFYAVLGAAMHDAFISAWWSKYEAMLVRPETLIREHLDPDWRPLLQTPNFPEYPSGHAVVGAAAAEVLTAFFGDLAFDDSYGVINAMPGFAGGENATRRFTSFHHAAEENALSRLYGGVHYRVAAENGVVQGSCAARRALSVLGPPTLTGK